MSILLINKPAGPTSHDIVSRARKIIEEKRVGHAGTLDPFATGLLILLTGKDTKRQSEFMGLDKAYEAVFVLGEERVTDDVTGERRYIGGGILSPSSHASGGPANRQRSTLGLAPPPPVQTLPARPAHGSEGESMLPSSEKVAEILKKFAGEIEQMPPAYSAKKIKGKRAYEIARKGGTPALKPKKVTVYNIELLGYKYPELKIRTMVSSGTYIRALARDIGRELGTGAYVKELKRTSIGPYSLREALDIEKLRKEI